MTDLTGKTALITGAGQGEGQGIALAMACAGAAVAVAGRTLEKLATTVELIEGLGGTAIALEVIGLFLFPTLEHFPN